MQAYSASGMYQSDASRTRIASAVSAADATRAPTHSRFAGSKKVHPNRPLRPRGPSRENEGSGGVTVSQVSRRHGE